MNYHPTPYQAAEKLSRGFQQVRAEQEAEAIQAVIRAAQALRVTLKGLEVGSPYPKHQRDASLAISALDDWFRDEISQGLVVTADSTGDDLGINLELDSYCRNYSGFYESCLSG